MHTSLNSLFWSTYETFNYLKLFCARTATLSMPMLLIGSWSAMEDSCSNVFLKLCCPASQENNWHCWHFSLIGLRSQHHRPSGGVGRTFSITLGTQELPLLLLHLLLPLPLLLHLLFPSLPSPSPPSPPRLPPPPLPPLPLLSDAHILPLITVFLSGYFCNAITLCLNKCYSGL